MNTLNSDIRILLIEDDSHWVKKITGHIKAFCPCKLKTLESYERAATFLIENQLEEFDAAIIDVRLREPIYDQGGLALLDILKSKESNLPALILTAYSYDYPGLREVTTRYRDVLTYDKEIFETDSAKILGALLSKLPPQIGDISKPANSSIQSIKREQKINQKQRPKTSAPISIISMTAAIIALILISMALVLSLFEKFSNYPFQLNAIFSIVTITLLCLLIKLFKPSVVREAVKLFKNLTSRGKK